VSLIVALSSCAELANDPASARRTKLSFLATRQLRRGRDCQWRSRRALGRLLRGGLAELRKIATVADTWDITIAPHLFPELNVHLLASIPNAAWAEPMGLLDDLWVTPLATKNGVLRKVLRSSGRVARPWK
jgi:hypothetical protein